MIPTGNDLLYEVWNIYNSQKVPDQKLNKKRGNNTKMRISDDENIQIISRKASIMVKENTP